LILLLFVFSASRRDVIFAKTQHGGHLGFFEGGLVYPDTITWLDKIVVQYANAALKTYRRSKLSAKWNYANAKNIVEIREILQRKICWHTVLYALYLFQLVVSNRCVG